MRWTGVLVYAGLAGAALPALAHHSISAMYDRDKTVEVQGVLSKLELVNPHALMEVTVPAARGEAATVWALESRGVQGMARSGFDKGAVAVGEAVTVKGSPARDGRKALWLASIKTPAGKTFEFGFGRPAN
ncbi:MAG: hypothetical protein B7Y99_03795 [Caulobacterales bacterium 32-69-10]|nr:MAG: hypothetical protein B7Y99_03795 [Caulobacterales bacterium 32-69-10]